MTSPLSPGSTTAPDGAGQRQLGLAAWPGALAGVAAAAAAIAASELLAGLVTGVPSLIVAIGTLVIDLQPPGAKDLVVGLFGTNDKLALNIGVVIAALIIAAGAGVLARRHPARGAAIFIAFGVVAALAAARQPQVGLLAAIVNATVAVVVGVGVLAGLLRLAEARRPAVRAGPRATDRRDVAGGPDRTAADPTAGPADPSGRAWTDDWDRRRFLIASAGTLGAAIVVGGIGRDLIQSNHPAGVVTTSRLPRAMEPVPPLAPAESLSIPGVTPIVIANDRFYRIDTALLVPRVDISSWQLKVTGMVDHPLTFTYDELLAMPLFEQYVTIACVSNEVGGHLVGNALWTGVRLKEVLAAAGVQTGATQVVGRSVDGFTVGFPTSWAMAPDREPMIAVGMDREPLPADHGFPARLIVPGLYGYVSATKWLSEIELTTLEAVDGYWVPLGWAKEAPILTQSRIDTPSNGATVAVGPVQVAGVAWAPDRGIERVELRVDDGDWQPTRMSQPISPATWVQWAYDWTATSGGHRLEVRAIDGDGNVQTSEVTPPAPDGARGHHRIVVTVG